MVPPRTEEKAMKVQQAALILQIIVAVALIPNIIHHW